MWKYLVEIISSELCKNNIDTFKIIMLTLNWTVFLKDSLHPDLKSDVKKHIGNVFLEKMKQAGWRIRCIQNENNNKIYELQADLAGVVELAEMEEDQGS